MARYEELYQGKTQKFTIRNATGADAAEVIRYMSLVNEESTFLSMEPGEFAAKTTLEHETELLQSLVDSTTHLSLLVQAEDGQIAGSCNCRYSTERNRYCHRATLGISVRKDFQRQGLARKMLQIQEDWCRTQGIEKLCLDVDTLNTSAISLYLSQGFVVEGTLHREAKMSDGTYRDLYVMAKFLK